MAPRQPDEAKLAVHFAGRWIEVQMQSSSAQSAAGELSNDSLLGVGTHDGVGSSERPVQSQEPNPV